MPIHDFGKKSEKDNMPDLPPKKTIKATLKINKVTKSEILLHDIEIEEKPKSKKTTVDHPMINGSLEIEEEEL